MCVLVACITASICARAADREFDTPDHFTKGADALADGRYDEAIGHLEAYADRMPSHPDASFNRGLAYLTRVRNGAERSGDLGRAAAAFEEALVMRPDDVDVAHSLELVHGEVARRRARRGEDAVLARPSLDRVVVGLANEQSWGIAAVIGSLLLACGLVLRKLAGSAHLAGVLMIPAGALVLAVTIPLYLGARYLRIERKPGVVVVREVHMTDESGAAMGLDPVPEAAKLELGERRGRLIHVRYGTVEGWIATDTVRVLRTH